ncbi:MAG: InlB B-repeat-containing protein [Clostridia bacterium]|nr:InlB B-repeat-containing protein [Clostridia bacterium]
MKRLLKVFLISSIVALLCMAFAVLASAEESYTLTYFHGDSAKNKEIYSAGEEVTLRTDKYSSNSDISGYEFLGWFTDDGVTYKPGDKITITRDIKLYEAIGKTVSNESEFRSAVSGRGWRVIKLGADITLTDNIYGNERSVSIFDLNGHTITYGTIDKPVDDWAIYTKRSGMIILGEGTFKHYTSKPNDKAFHGGEPHGYNGDDGAHRLWIGKNVKIITNAPLTKYVKDMSGVSQPTFRFYGDITCAYLVYVNGFVDVDVNIYDPAKITIIDESTDLFPIYGWGSSSNKPVVATAKELIYFPGVTDNYVITSLNVYGGKFSFPDSFKGFVAEGKEKFFPVSINGGTFDIDIAKYISVDFKTVQNPDGTYSVEPNICPSPTSPTGRHKYLATEITVTCLDDGEISYACEYCKESYTAQRFALGHNVIRMKTSDLVNTANKTSPGIYTNTCARCGSVETEYFYPDPGNVYVTVKARFERDGVKYVETFRVPSKLLFGFSVDEDTDLKTETYLTSFSVQALKHTTKDGKEVKLKQSEIVAIEIPLGTTKIYGGYLNNSYTGLFYKNDHIEEVTLPSSLNTVMRGAFAEMPKLTKVTGVEYISTLIDEYAFGQHKNSANLIFDTLEIKAETVNASAFKNVLATRIYIRDSVRFLRDAFRLDSEIAQAEASYDKNKGRLKEVFVEALSKNYPADYKESKFYNRTLSDIWNSLTNDEKAKIFSEASPGSALLTKANTYFDHTYDIVIHAPNCIEDGYTAYECLQCGLSTKSDFVPHEGITHVWERNEEFDKQPTCSKEGYTAEYCKICESVQVLEVLPRNDKHDFSTTTPEPDYDACTKTTFFYRRRCANGCGAWSKTTQQKVTLTAPLGHAYSTEDDGVTKIPATCGTPGQTIKTCTRCYEQDVIETPATGVHSFIRDDSARVAPTCASPGANYFNCTVCGAKDTKELSILTYEEAVAQNAHIWKEEITIQPTTKSEGIKRVYCTLCNSNKQGASIYVPKLVDEGPKTWLIVVIVAGSVAILGGVGATVYVTLFKKNNASKNYKYKFNTFKK